MSKRYPKYLPAILVLFLISLGVFKFVIVKSCYGPSEQQQRMWYFSSLQTALDVYYQGNGYYPTTEQGLGALIQTTTLEPLPKQFRKGGYLDKVPVDSSENKFIYINDIESELGPILLCCREGRLFKSYRVM